MSGAEPEGCPEAASLVDGISGRSQVKDSSHVNQRLRLFKTICIYMGAACLGLGATVMGPTFTAMESLLATDTEKLGAAFTADNVGYLVGSAVAAGLFDRLPPEPQVAMSLAVAGVATAVAPTRRSLPLFVAAMSIQGAGLAYLDAGTQAYCLSVWRGHRLQDSFIQGIFMTWSVGSTTAPLILQLFLGPAGQASEAGTANGCVPRSAAIGEDGNASMFSTTSDMTLSNYHFEQGQSVSNGTNVSCTGTVHQVNLVGYGYLTIGLLLIPAAITYLILYCIVRTEKRNGVHVQEQPAQKPRRKFQTHQWVLVGFFVLLFFVYVGQEVTFGGFLALFTIRGLCWENHQGALITSLFWGSTGVGRMLGVPLSVCLRPAQLLALNIVLSAAAFVLVNVCAEAHPAVMWCGTVMAGLGMSTMYPSAYLWCSRHVATSGFITALFLAAGSLAAMLLPFLTGILIQRIHPWVFLYMMLCTGAALVLLYVIITVLISRCFRQGNTSNERENESASTCKNVSGDGTSQKLMITQ